MSNDAEEESEGWQADPLVRELTKAKVEAHVSQFIGLLNGNASEAEIHSFLASHTYFFQGFIRLYTHSPVYSKVRLGSQHLVDFAWVDDGSVGPQWTLVEIEAPSKKLFTESGEPSHHLKSAIAQVRNWFYWLHQNLPYAQQLMPHIEFPEYKLFIGRRRKIREEEYKALKRLKYDYRPYLDIHSLDLLAFKAKEVVNWVGEDHGGDWPLPLKAYSHKDLENKRPKGLHQWLSAPYVVREANFRSEYRREQESSYEVLREEEELDHWEDDDLEDYDEVFY